MRKLTILFIVLATVTLLASCKQEPEAKATFVTTKITDTTCSIKANENVSVPAQLEIPSSYEGLTVTGIDGSGFYAHDEIKSLVIPDNVTTIGEHAFRYCSRLESVTLGNGITEIKKWAFANCGWLETINFPDSLKTIGESAFAVCDMLKTVDLNKVETIEGWAFDNCKVLEFVTLGTSVTSIGKYAFAGCPGLTDITYKGTKAQWEAIEKGLDWDGSIKHIHCSDGDIDL